MRPLAGASLLIAAVLSMAAGASPGSHSHDGAPAVGAAYQATVPNQAVAPNPAPAGMVWIPGGEFSMGGDQASEGMCELPGVVADAQPVHRVYVDGFWMDRTEVTNAQFEKFVKATGYVTVAEKAPTREEFPDAPAENLVAGALVFTPVSAPVRLDNHYQWWRYQHGANWRHPEGPESDLKGRQNHPVVQIAWEDAVAYSRWAGKRLPTEAEWEFAARGGLAGKLFAWGDDFLAGGIHLANTYQGNFPIVDSGEDGYKGLAPVAKFPPNAYGLYDVAGNAWEWVSDWYRPDYYAQLAARAAVTRNPRGPDTPFDPQEPTEKKRVQRGGSFLCTDQYCTRYMVGTRGRGEARSASDHVGFRCVKGPTR